jgi:hypothetical protein
MGHMDNSTLEPKPVNWEAVRMLALVVGVRESARRMGLSEEAVKRRCTREGWLASPEAKAANKMAIAGRSGRTPSLRPVLSPSEVLHGELKALGEKSRLSIARGIAKAGEHIETMDGQEILIDSANVKNIAPTADLVHGWKEQPSGSRVRLDVLLSKPGSDVVEIEAEVQPEVSASWSEDSMDLDNY